MKRIILATALLLVTSAVMANESMVNDSVNRYLSSTMGQNWFVTATGSVNWWQGSDRNPAGNYTSLNGPTFGGGVSLGKWITHNVALRLAYDVNRSHSYINGFHTANGGQFDFLYENNPTPDANGYCTTTFMYHNFHGDFMVSPVDLIQGYFNPDRFFTPLFYVGAGLACVSGHTSMIQSLMEGKRNFEYSVDAGFMGLFKLTPYLDIDLQLMWTSQKYSIDSWYNEYISADRTIRPRFADFNYSASLGLNWNIHSRIYELPINYAGEMREMRERISQLEAELEDCMKNQGHITDTVVQFIGSTDTVKEIVSFPFSIFFNLDSYELMSRRDVVNLREIARVAADKGWKIRLRGSCDSATATPEYNQRLSENRCRKIMLELMELGIPESQIILVPVGGVHELDPTEYDRRVLIELVKEIK